MNSEYAALTRAFSIACARAGERVSVAGRVGAPLRWQCAQLSQSCQAADEAPDKVSGAA
jgi:hypothetical protein